MGKYCICIGWWVVQKHHQGKLHWVKTNNTHLRLQNVSPPPPHTNTTYKHHHTVHVEYLCQWLEGKTSEQVAVSHDYQRASGLFASVDGRKSTTSTSCIGAKWSGAYQQHATTTTTITTTDQIKTSTGAIGLTDAAIKPTCVNAHHSTLRK